MYTAESINVAIAESINVATAESINVATAESINVVYSLFLWLHCLGVQVCLVVFFLTFHL